MQRLLRRYAVGLPLFFSALTAILLHAGCIYAPVRLAHTVPVAGYGESGSESVPPAGTASRLYEKKYFARALGFSSAVRANNSGVDRALRGDFPEAIVLFREAIEIDVSMAEPYNNSALIYELSGNRQEAYAMYMKACMLDPYNKTYRNNFLFCNDTK